MDEIDQANEASELALQYALNRARNAGPLVTQGTGVCLFCGEAVPPGARWCGVECRDGWEKLNRHA